MRTLLLLLTLLSFIPDLQSQEVQTEKAVKRLYLVRHAKSSHENPNLKDFDRPLNNRGKKDASVMGGKLQAAGVILDHVISSPARRNRQTAKLLLEKMAIDLGKVNWDQGLYRCAPMILQERIKAIDDQFGHVMVFGHNPAITAVANFFQKDSMIQHVPTSGVIAIEFQTSSWAEADSTNGKLLFFERPPRSK